MLIVIQPTTVTNHVPPIWHTESTLKVTAYWNLLTVLPTVQMSVFSDAAMTTIICITFVLQKRNIMCIRQKNLTHANRPIRCQHRMADKKLTVAHPLNKLLNFWNAADSITAYSITL